MAALTAARNTPEFQEDREYVYPVEANTNIYLGAMVGLNANGNAVPMSAATGLKIIGRAERVNGAQYPGENALNNPGAAGAILLVVRRGVFKFNNDATIVQGKVGQICFAQDDNTVSAGTAVAAAVQAIGATPAGTVIALAGRPIVPGSVSVTTDPAGTTYQEGRDYLVNYDGGAIILPVGTTITASANALLNYTHSGARSIAGRVVGIDIDGGIWVDSRFPFAIAA